MPAGEARDIDGETFSLIRENLSKRHRVLVRLNDEQMAAAEGWRLAHGIEEQSEALGELVRLGLLSEVARIYRLVSENRPAMSGRPRGGERKYKSSNQAAD